MYVLGTGAGTGINRGKCSCSWPSEAVYWYLADADVVPRRTHPYYYLYRISPGDSTHA
jgi:hypothetical protein